MSEHKFYYPYDIYDGNCPPKTDARSDIIEAKCLHCDGKYAIDVLVRTRGFPKGASPIITQIRMRHEKLLKFIKTSLDENVRES